MKIENLKIDNLSARMYLPDKTIKEVLITIHGFTGDKESSVICALANELVLDKFCVVSFDLPYHGENISDSNLSLEKFFQALKSVESFAKKRFKLPISYFATSFGAFLLLNHLQTSNTKYNKIILRAPAIEMAKILINVLMKDHGYNLLSLKYNTLNFGYTTTLMIDYKFYDDLLKYDLCKIFDNKQNRFFYVLQGLKDNVVAPESVKNFFENKCKENYNIFEFENADHGFKDPGELQRIIDITQKILNS